MPKVQNGILGKKEMSIACWEGVMMSRQYRLFDDDSKDAIMQFKCDPIMKRDFILWCAEKRIPYAVIFRVFVEKVLDNRRTYPGYQTNTTKELQAACTDVIEFVPILVKQHRVNPGLY